MSFAAVAARALDTAHARGATYADVRVEEHRSERIEVRNANVTTLSDGTSVGYGVRAYVDGAWGFAAGSNFSDEAIDMVAARAVAIARAGARVAVRRFAEAPNDAFVDEYVTPISIDPVEVPLGDRVALLLEAERAVHVDPRVRVGQAWIALWRTRKEFFNTNGSCITQTLYHTGSGLSALAVDEHDAQQRVYPGDSGLYQGGGWEIVDFARLRENAARIGEEATALLSAPQCPSGEFDLILGSSQVALQIHESCGHATELDRVFGWEANFSGTSFLRPQDIGNLRYGSPLVSIVVDHQLPRGFASVAYDDEGTKAGRDDIVRDGMFVGFLSSRDTAPLIGRSSNACVRAADWGSVPMVRICNLSLESPPAGTRPFESLFEDVDYGIHMESNRSWSIDDHRLNFQFGCQIAWEIRNGKRGRMLKNPTYGGVTPQFWQSCDAIADADLWVAWGIPCCGKGEPLQEGRTTEAVAPVRFRKVRVGVGYDG